MSDLEMFGASESTEGVDAGAMERLREQMKAAAAQMKGDQQQEQKQKKDEDTLYEALVSFVNTLGAHDPLVVLIVKCLAANILSNVILTVLALNYKTLHEVVGIELISPNNGAEADKDEDALIVPKLGEDDLDLYIKVNLDHWIHRINEVVFESPIRNLHGIKQPGDTNRAKGVFVNLVAYMAQDYLEKNNQPFFGENVLKFTSLVCTNLIERLIEHTNSQPKLESGNE